jgi:hypothetical protein
MAFDPSRLRFGDLIAGASAVLLFIFMLFDWYTVSVEGFGRSIDLGGGSAWEAFDIGDIFLLLVILATLAIVVMRALGQEPAGLPLPLSTIVLIIGGLASLYILFRLIVTPFDVPDGVDVGRGIGIFLGFIAALGITAGAFLSARERGEALPGVGAVGAGAPGGPLGGGEPGAGQAGGYGGQPAAGAPTAGTPAGGAAPAAGAADPGAQAATAGSPAPDWYEDPRGEARLRYWDGTQWTDQTAD